MKSIRRKKSLRKKKSIRRKSIRRKKSPIRRKKSPIRRKNKFKYDGVIIDELDELEFKNILIFLEKNDIDNLRQVSKTVEKITKLNSAKLNKKGSLKYINNTDNFRKESDNLDFKEKFDNFLARKKITSLHLNLYKCSLRYFPYFESPNEKIVVLNLSNNYIKNIPSDIGIKLPKLRILDLSYCELTTFPNFELHELLELNLNENDIKTIPDDIGIKLPKLEVLNLRNCGLTSFPHFEAPLNELIELDLNLNSDITTIPDDIGIKLPKLKILYLSFCGLTDFPNFELLELVKLDLSFNDIIKSTIPVNRFGKLISSDGIIYPKLPKLEICVY